MKRESAGSRWEPLQVKSHVSEARANIRRGISRGVLRVVPAAGGGNRMIRLMDNSITRTPTLSAAVPELGWTLHGVGDRSTERRA